MSPASARRCTVDPKPARSRGIRSRLTIADLANPPLQHRDPGVEDLLPFLRRLVLGVLAQVAELARTLDLLRELDLQLPFERGDFFVESFENAVFHVRFRL